MNLTGRHFLKELDFTAEEFRGLVDLAAELKAAKKAGTETQCLKGRNVALIFEKSSTRTRCSFEVAAADQGASTTYIDPAKLAHRQEGVEQGHRPRARPDVRRHRVPGRRAGHRGDARRVRGRAGLQRPDRRLAPHADARRRAHDDRAQRQAARRDVLRLPRRRPVQHGQLVPRHRRPARHGRPDRRAEGLLALPRRSSSRPASWPPPAAPASRSRRPSRRASPAPTSWSPTYGCRWASRRRSGTSGSRRSRRTR